VDIHVRLFGGDDHCQSKWSLSLSVAGELKSFGHAISFRCGFSAAMARRQGCGRILMYHGIVPESAQELIAQLRFLTRHFKVVTLEKMVHGLENGSALRANEIALTFDDGLRNNVSVVYPILRQLQVPVTFFVCPGLIETGTWLWNHEVRCRLQTLAAPALAELRISLLAPGNSVEGMVEWMKTLHLPQRLKAEQLIRQATPDFQATPAQQTAFDMMSWEELLSLDPALVTIGSHTMSHPILTTLTAEEIEVELRESRHCLEQRLQRPVEFFCYPNGSYDARAYQAVKKNYHAAVTTESGVVDRRDGLDLHRLPRIPSADSAALTAWRLHRPEA
jgi:peptidoglycan/xylan/chitin deacetylase (PgdA/CDA1 family)